MKKIIALLAAVGIVASAGTTIVSCSLKGEKTKGGTTDPSTKDKEVNQALLKKRNPRIFRRKNIWWKNIWWKRVCN